MKKLDEMPSPSALLATSVQGLRPDGIVGVTITTQKVDPDRLPRIQQAHDYPREALWPLAGFTALVALCHLLVILSTLLFPQRHARPEGARSSPSLRRIPAALLDTFRVIAYRCTIPIGGSHSLNLAEVFLTAAYITIIFVWSLVHSTNSKGMLYDPKYWGNTAGNVAATQLSVVAALGTRNNIISWITGISFDKLNYLHRMSARAVCVLTWVHGAGRMMLGITGAVGWDHPFTQAGLLASIALSVLSIFSVRPLREAGYEVFVVVHFLLVFIVILSAYFHAQEFELGYFIWPAFLIWGMDRLIQVLRTFILNAGYFKARSHELDARIDVLSPHFLRLRLYRPNFFHWRPGQSALLTLPTVSTLPLETHPFTISTIDTPAAYKARTSGEVTPPSPSGSDEKRDNLPDNVAPGKELTFLIRVRRGLTGKLLDAATKGDTVKVLVDGPYSSPPWLRGFDSVVLIAGGSGVAFTLPMLLDTIRRAKANAVGVCRRVTFIWAIRELEHTQWISDALVPALQDIPSTLVVDIKFYVTGLADDSQAQSLDDDSSHSDHESKGQGDVDVKGGQLLQSSVVTVENGRPNLKALLDAEIARASGPMSVNVCGTHTLANVVRGALRKPRFMDILKGGPTVTLHIEAFGSS
ncbi:hypothetical protein CCMSSC00406_0005663 [Pleurotus cornucopiae]|uniref:Uncharacterized protein n=1 Tax=Pleurotus cornucopiae TaxID=5321 RepID=A0ACB7IW20_PLECO|nr:hypothetical protein CCMSSC00406_0005663 [Pleurotus cornucopiae]